MDPWLETAKESVKRFEADGRADALSNEKKLMLEVLKALHGLIEDIDRIVGPEPSGTSRPT